MTTIFVVFLLFVAPALVNYEQAKGKNRNYVAWVVFAVFLGWLSTIILACLTKRDRPVEY